MDEPDARPDPHLTDATIEHELRMVGEAVDAVGTGRFPSITLAGLRFADELLPRARELALVRNVEVRPLSIRAPTGRTSRSSDPGAQPGPMTGTILLVEDDEPLRSIARPPPSRRGYEVVESGIGRGRGREPRAGPAARAGDARHQPAWRHRLEPAARPRARGRRRSAGRSSPPPRRSDPRRLREHDVAGYLPKPFALETLIATIERLVGRRAATGDR